MKKISCLLLLFALVACLTGCMRFHTTFTIKKNGKMDVSLLYAMIDMSQYSDDESGSSGLTDEQVKEYEKDGWSVKDYTDDGYKGFIIAKDDVSIAELNAMMNKTAENTNQGGKFELTKDGLVYHLTWQIYDNTDKSSMSQVAPYITQSGGYMKFTLNLPSKPVSSNATSTSDNGKTLEWDLLKLDEDGCIDVTYRLINLPLIIIVAVSALAVTAGVVVLIIVLCKKKNRKNPSMGY